MKWDGHYTLEQIGHTKYLFWRIPVWRVVLNKDFPLCYEAQDGIRYRPEMCFSSDGGSIPYSLQNIASMVPFINLKRDCFIRSYVLHDSSYQQHGLWTWAGYRWVFNTLDRGRVDAILYESLLAEGANHAEASIVYAGVRAGGWVPWRNYADSVS